MSLHVLYSFPLRLGVPGIGMTAWNQVIGLVQLGMKVTLCCGTCERPIPGLHRLVETMRIAGVRVPYRLTGLVTGVRLHDLRVARLLQRSDTRFSVVHAWPLGALRTFQVARAANIPTVLERPNAHTKFAQEVVAEEHARLGLRLDNSNTHSVSSRRLAVEEAEYSLASKLACPSDFVARTFVERGFSTGRIARHQYGYDPAQFHPETTTRVDSRFTAVFVGRCEPRKGLHYALQAWHDSRAADVGRFIICGAYVPGYRELLEPLLRHPSIEERGFVQQVDVVLREADVLVLPSIEEGSALVTYEARGAGCLLLVSDAAGAVGTDGLDIVVHESRNVTQLASQLRDLSSNSAQLQEMKRRSLDAASELTWKYAAGLLVGAYKDAIAERCRLEHGR